MYKKLLLTPNETKLLLDIINTIDYNKNPDLQNEVINLHIIKRNLLGLIPTEKA